MSSGGGEWPPRSGARWGTTDSEKSGEGVRRRGGVPRRQNMSSEGGGDLGDDRGVGDMGGEARRKRKSKNNGISSGH
jgi:hypothetical protein